MHGNGWADGGRWEWVGVWFSTTQFHILAKINSFFFWLYLKMFPQKKRPETPIFQGLTDFSAFDPQYNLSILCTEI